MKGGGGGAIRDMKGEEFDLKEALENLPVFVYIRCGENGTMAYYGGVREVTGYSPDEIDSLPGGYESIVFPEDAGDAISRKDWIIGSAGCRGSLEYRIVRKDGSQGWVHEDISVKRSDGHPDSIRGVVYDITERMERFYDSFDDMRRFSRPDCMLFDCGERYRSVVEDQIDFVCRFESSGVITFSNGAYRKRFIWAGGDGNMSFYGIFTDPARDSLFQSLSMLCRERPMVTVEHRIPAVSGPEQWVQWKIRVVPPANGKRVEFQAVGRDITDLKNAEERIRYSLAEKEALLGEVHHRVKNNLQIISSLLDISSLRASGEETVNLIRDARSRIHTIALIHGQLMKSERFDSIDINMHVNELISHLFKVHAELRERVYCESRIFGVYLNVERAMPFALVLHEILSNSLKHAFPSGREGTITIQIESKKDGMIVANISDDGVGIPGNADPEAMDTFGLRMIQLIVREHLGGTLERTCLNGTMYRIVFRGGESEGKKCTKSWSLMTK